MTPTEHILKQEKQVFLALVCLLSIYSLYGVLGTPTLPVFLLILGSAFGLTTLYPRAGFAALIVATLFFERFFTLEPLLIGEALFKLYPLDAVLVAVLLGLGFVGARRNQEPRQGDASSWWLVAFFAYITFLFFLSIGEQSNTSLAVAFSTWKQYVFYGVLALITPFVIRTEKDFHTGVKVFFGGVAATSIFLLIGALRGEGLWTEYTPLSTSGTRFLAFPHAFYFSLALLSLLLSLPYWYKESGKRAMRIVFLWVLALGVLGSLMRHLWLGLGGVLVGALLVRPRVYTKFFAQISLPFLAPLVLLTSLLLYFVAVFPNSNPSYDLERASNVVLERIVSIGNENDESLAWRGVVWESAFKAFRESPLLGIGFGKSVPVELSQYQQYVEVRDMHNSWLALLIQTGVVGVVLLGGYITLLVVKVLRVTGSTLFIRSVRAALVGLLFFQGLVFFSQPYLETNLLGIFFWLTLGLLRAVLLMEPTEETKS